MIRRKSKWPLIALMLVVGCRAGGESSLTGSSERNELSAWASPSVVAAFESKAVSFDRAAASERPQLSKAQAITLAQNIARVAGGIREQLRRDREGRELDYDRLTPCGQVYYARPKTQPALEGQSRAFVNLTGPQWFVTFCAGEEPQLSISVAAYAVDLIPEGGKVRFPKNSGGEFLFAGIPPGASSLPISPEDAIRIAATETGMVVDSIPELVGVGRPWIPQAAQWRIVLRERLDDGAQGLRSVDPGLKRKEVFVGFRLDGVAAVGRDAFVAQVPDGRPRLATSRDGQERNTNYYNRVTRGTK